MSSESSKEIKSWEAPTGHAMPFGLVSGRTESETRPAGVRVVAEPSPFRVELATPDDLNVIRSQWMADVFQWPDAHGRGRTYWMETEPEARDMLLAALGAFVVRDVAGAPDNVVGWAVVDLPRRTLHWAQVKRRWRGQGAGRLLFACVPPPPSGSARIFTRYAHTTQRARLEREKWAYRPHLAYTVTGGIYP